MRSAAVDARERVGEGSDQCAVAQPDWLITMTGIRKRTASRVLAKVEAGGDLWPHQSRRIGDVAAEDAMLNDYGIQHFHLGTTPDPRRPQLIQGTKELLFAVVKDSDFYALGIFDHSAWSKQALLDIIQANWPQLIASYTIPNAVGLSHNYTEAEVAALRKSNINVIQQRPDGTVHMGLGGGITTNGKSMAATVGRSRRWITSGSYRTL